MHDRRTANKYINIIYIYIYIYICSITNIKYTLFINIVIYIYIYIYKETSTLNAAKPILSIYSYLVSQSISLRIQ